MPFRADATRLLDYVPTGTERCFTFLMVTDRVTGHKRGEYQTLTNVTLVKARPK